MWGSPGQAGLLADPCSRALHHTLVRGAGWVRKAQAEYGASLCTSTDQAASPDVAMLGTWPTHHLGMAVLSCWGHLSDRRDLQSLRLSVPAGEQQGVGTGLISGAGGHLAHHLASPATPPCVPLSTPAFMVTRAMVKFPWGGEMGFPTPASSVSLRKKENNSLSRPQFDWIKKSVLDFQY